MAAHAKHETIHGKTYYGLVVNNNDPLKYQRLQIRINDLMDNIEDADLPWCAKEAHVLQSNTSGTGSISIPKIGSKVSVEFMDDSLYHGKWTGAVNTQEVQNSELVNDNYPNVIASIDDSGNKTRINTATNEVTWTHVSGGQVDINGSGIWTITTAGNIIININGTCNFIVSGNTTISSQGILNINSSQLNLNSGAGTAPTAAVPRTRPA